MTYPASLDKTAIAITWLVTLLFIGIGGFQTYQVTQLDQYDTRAWVLMGANGLLVVIFAICYLYRTVGYAVDRVGVTIQRPIGNKVIRLEEIRKAFMVDKEEMGWVFRTFGVGGLFGYFGKFRSRSLGNMTWYATRRDRYLVIVTADDRKMVTTPDDPKMLDEIYRLLKSEAGG
ncbi:MAG: PH domain-containing protein [Cyclobacteriaceae bacterium]